MVGGQANVKLVSNAMANAMRRKIMAMLVEGNRTKEEIGTAVGQSMLDYHLQMLQQADLVNIKDDAIVLTEFGKNSWRSRPKSRPRSGRTFSGLRPCRSHRSGSLLPCIADASKFRIIARMEPNLGMGPKTIGASFSQGQILRED